MEAGRDLDKLVAEKVMGESFRPYAQVLTTYPSKTVPETPFYSTSIEAAWEVVEKIIKLETFASRTAKLIQNGDGWIFTPYHEDEIHFDDPDTAPTAPLAIALAALKAIQQSK